MPPRARARIRPDASADEAPHPLAHTFRFGRSLPGLDNDLVVAIASHLLSSLFDLVALCLADVRVGRIVFEHPFANGKPLLSRTSPIVKLFFNVHLRGVGCVTEAVLRRFAGAARPSESHRLQLEHVLRKRYDHGMYIARRAANPTDLNWHVQVGFTQTEIQKCNAVEWILRARRPRSNEWVDGPAVFVVMKPHTEPVFARVYTAMQPFEPGTSKKIPVTARPKFVAAAVWLRGSFQGQELPCEYVLHTIDDDGIKRTIHAVFDDDRLVRQHYLEYKVVCHFSGERLTARPTRIEYKDENRTDHYKEGRMYKRVCKDCTLFWDSSDPTDGFTRIESSSGRVDYFTGKRGKETMYAVKNGHLGPAPNLV